ncbi:thiolase family protein [Cnuibacter physcomitrellae]|uniref:thiolase family protein n=1 Tax=Cnuibacter physcomitrellae TaxID=1619308 RepID=UPI001E3B3E7C|nr:thiolase family protein [Cnuibacter physcomitrellae]
MHHERDGDDAMITGVGLTEFGRDSGSTALELQARAAYGALDDSGLSSGDVDTVIVGYATTLNHIMPANVLAEYLGARPERAFGMSVGGATGLAMVAEAVRLVRNGEAENVLVVGGENRASGQTRDTAIATLAQVGHATHEVLLGANIPAYYALLAAEYLDRYGLGRADLAPLAVQMRAHAVTHPGAQFRKPISVDDVLAAPLIADPLGLLDCCPISDGAAAVVISIDRGDPRAVTVAGIGQSNPHQHVSEADFHDVGARSSAQAALREAGVAIDGLEILGIYDSFTITLAILLEQIGIVEPGTAGRRAAEGLFGPEGRFPLNLHGGLLSYGHSGVAGGMAHLVEMVVQMRGEAQQRQLDSRPRRGLLHADGGVLSAHVTAVLSSTMKGGR